MVVDCVSSTPLFFGRAEVILLLVLTFFFSAGQVVWPWSLSPPFQFR